MSVINVHVQISPVEAALTVDGRQVLYIRFIIDGKATGSTLADFFRAAAAYCEAQKIKIWQTP